LAACACCGLHLQGRRLLRLPARSVVLPATLVRPAALVLASARARALPNLRPRRSRNCRCCFLLRSLPRLFLGDEAGGQQLIAQRTVHGRWGRVKKGELRILTKAVVIALLARVSARLGGWQSVAPGPAIRPERGRCAIRAHQ